jgi:hypothetical protein
MNQGNWESTTHKRPKASLPTPPYPPPLFCTSPATLLSVVSVVVVDECLETNNESINSSSLRTPDIPVVKEAKQKLDEA